jgi:hypothetical protein
MCRSPDAKFHRNLYSSNFKLITWGQTDKRTILLLYVFTSCTLWKERIKIALILNEQSSYVSNRTRHTHTHTHTHIHTHTHTANMSHISSHLNVFHVSPNAFKAQDTAVMMSHDSLWTMSIFWGTILSTMTVRALKYFTTASTHPYSVQFTIHSHTYVSPDDK